MLAFALLALGTTQSQAAHDWPQWGGSSLRNNVADDRQHLPTEWKLGGYDAAGRWQAAGAQNVLWVARLGSESYGSPVVAGGRVFASTNNAAGYLARYPASVDLGCLLAFGRSDGRLLWQYSVEKLPDSTLDWPKQGLCCGPLVEGNRLWVANNRAEVACIDTEGTAGSREAKVVWRFDMMARLGSRQHNMACCSVTSAGELLLVGTSNGVDADHKRIAAPEAPSFIALDKRSGKLVWADASPGRNILHGQWGSPAYAVLGGVPQAIFPGGDGWLYSFLAARGTGGKPQLLWKFDCNPKTAVWKGEGRGDRNELISTPVIWEGRVYLATGQDPEAGEGQGDLWCIDPTRRGDTSAEIVVDAQGKPVPPRRLSAVDLKAGEQVRPNPNSAALWHYRGAAKGEAAKSDGEAAFKETMHRSMSMVAIKDGLLVTADFNGLVHCLDARSGRPHWTYDMLSAIWGSPLVADGKVYLGDEDGDVAVFEFSKQGKLLAKNPMGEAVFTTPVALDGVLYVAARSHLAAIGAKEER